MWGFNAHWTFLFLISDRSYLKNFGMFSIPLSISFRVTEFIALEPVPVLRFAKLLASSFPVCVLRKFLNLYIYIYIMYIYIYIYSFCPVLCLCVCKSEPYFFFVFRLFLGPTVLLDTRMFPGNCFLLILSYLDTKYGCTIR